MEADWPGPSFVVRQRGTELDDRIRKVAEDTVVRACYLALKPLLFTLYSSRRVVSLPTALR